MTPQELTRMQAMIDDSVNRAIDRAVTKLIQPLRDDIDQLKLESKALEADTRKHSGTHKDLLDKSGKISDNDMKQDAAIATILTKVAAIEANQATTKATAADTQSLVEEVHNAVTPFFRKHPEVVTAIAVAVVAVFDLIARWAAAH